MVFNGPVPWYDVPARKFPAQRWVEERYGFSLPPLRLRTGWPPEREFPVKAWVRGRQADAA